MLYLLDANVLMDANRDYYSIDRVPEFWQWLEHKGAAGEVKIPHEIFQEIARGKDQLAKLAKQDNFKKALLLDEMPNPAHVNRVLVDGYGVTNPPNDIESETMGSDPLLVAYALVEKNERAVVTTEQSSPKKIGANRKVPDVCKSLGISAFSGFDLYKELDFRTGWEKP